MKTRMCVLGAAVTACVASSGDAAPTIGVLDNAPPGTLVGTFNGRVIAGRSGPFKAAAMSLSRAIAAEVDGGLVQWGVLDVMDGFPWFPTDDCVALACGGSATAAIRSDGSAFASTWLGVSDFPGSFRDIACYNQLVAALTSADEIQWLVGTPPTGAPTSGAFKDIDFGLNGIFAAVRADGTLLVVGGSLAALPLPRGTFETVSVGSSHAIALSSEGEAVCWGDPAFGKCDSPPGPFVAVAAGATHSLGLRPDGTLVQWGSAGGEAPDGAFTAIDAASKASLAIRVDGTVATWGTHASGVAIAPGQAVIRAVRISSNAIAVLRADGRLDQIASAVTPPLPSTSVPGAYRDVASTTSVIAAVRDDGSIVTSGVGPFGDHLPPEGAFIAISGGQYHFAALDADGFATCWGLNAWGQCSAPRETFRSITCGSYHTVALRTDGTPVAWGDNTHGQCDCPQLPFVEISAGIGHTVGRLADGTLIAWGANYDGQCDVDEAAYVSVTATVDATFAVRQDGSLACFGENLTLCSYIPAVLWQFNAVGDLVTTGPDCDGDGTPDFSEIFAGEADVNEDGVPDACGSPFDLDGDGQVSATDLAVLLGTWGGAGLADFDGDGTVGANDLAILLGAWGA